MGLCTRKAANIVRIKCTETGRVCSEKELNTNILMQVQQKGACGLWHSKHIQDAIYKYTKND
jgi:hypothetical protein